MRRLDEVIDQMVAVLSCTEDRAFRKGILEDLRARIPFYPDEAMPVLWMMVANQVMEPVFLRLLYKNRPLSEEEQRLYDIFKGTSSPKE